MSAERCFQCDKLYDQDEVDITDYLIWWLSPAEIRVINDFVGIGGHLGPADLPEYIRSEYRSLQGHHGRLWANPRFGEINVSDVWPANAFGAWLELCEGIVFDNADLQIVSQYPGVVTNTRMERVR